LHSTMRAAKYDSPVGGILDSENCSRHGGNFREVLRFQHSPGWRNITILHPKDDGTVHGSCAAGRRLADFVRRSLLNAQDMLLLGHHFDGHQRYG
jgi:hypothetical protein